MSASSFSKLSKLLFLLPLGAMAMATPGASTYCDGINRVVAGAGLTGGGSTDTVTLSIANSGITTSMLAPATVQALQGARGPAGPAGPAGPRGLQGPRGTGGVYYRQEFQKPDFSNSLFDLTAFGTGGTDQNSNFVAVVPSITKSVTVFVPTASIVNYRDVTWANGPQDANGFTFTNYVTDLQVLDGNNQQVARTGTLTQDFPGGFLLQNSALKLQPGQYTFVVTYAALSTLQFDNNTSNYTPLAIDASLIQPNFVLEVLPTVN